jgi:hypothetical protein
MFCRSGLLGCWPMPSLQKMATTSLASHHSRRPGTPTHLHSPDTRACRKAVCKSCNTGWMSSLGSEVRPFLETMVRGESVQLDEGRQLALARWAAKVAVLLEHYEGGMTVLGASDLEQIVGGNAPISFHIRLALRTEDHPSPFRLYLTSHFAAPVGTTKDTRREANSFSGTLGLGRAAVSVIGGPGVDNPNRWRSGGEFPLMIWPPTPGHISWPPQRPVLPAREALRQFHEGFWKRIEKALVTFPWVAE